MIRKDQMTKEWALRRAVPSGRGEYRRELWEDPNSPTLLLGFPRYMIREILLQVIGVARAILTQDTETAFKERALCRDATMLRDKPFNVASDDLVGARRVTRG